MACTCAVKGNGLDDQGRPNASGGRKLWRLRQVFIWLLAVALAFGVLGGANAVPRYGSGPLVSDDCYPFDRSDADDSNKKVFAYYFPPFPVSIDNKGPAEDYYARWLDPQGGGGEYADTGGHLRDRPLGRPARDQEDWRQLDYEWEIRQATDMGLDGFILQTHALGRHETDQRWNHVDKLLAAAVKVNPEFEFVLAPMATRGTPHQLADALLPLANHPSVLRLGDGRLPVVSFMMAEDHPLKYWREFRSRMRGGGVETALMPIFVSRGSRDKLPNLEEWYGEIAGYSIWDGHFASVAASNESESAAARERGLIWIARAMFQDIRIRRANKIELRHWEPQNTQTLRALFEHAIAGDAPWMNIVTWNDYQETQVAPSQARGYAIGDVMAYYIEWFKTGSAPEIVRDALYYTHRPQLVDAPFDKKRQTAGAFQVDAGPAAEDYVELLAFLTGPGRLVVTQGDDRQVMDVDSAGVSSFRVPLKAGAAPKFELLRSGQVVTSTTSSTRVKDAVVYQDMTYRAGGGLSCDRPAP